jgi:hypothetical protein
MGYLSSGTINIISTPQLTSSLIGLGSMGYLSSGTINIISTLELTSSLQGLGSMGYISSAQLTSTAQGLTTYINSFIDPLELASSITGLGTVQFISSIGLLSTSQGLANYITSFIDPLELASTVTGLGTAQYVSTTVTATNVIFTSSLVGLGSMGYISTPQLTSSLQGLAYMGYMSSSLVQGTGISLTNGNKSITIANTGVLSITQGTGISISGSAGNYTITATVATADLVSTTSGIQSLQISSLTSSLVGLGTLGYLSSGTINLISTPQLTSSLVGLGSLGYLSTPSLISTVSSMADHFKILSAAVSSLNASNIYSLQGYFSSLTISSLTFRSGDGFLDFPDLRAISLSTLTLFTSTINGEVPLSRSILQSTIVGLGTLGYLSSGTINVISTPQLFSSLIGLGTLGYLSSSALCSFSTSLANPLGNFNVMSTGRTTASTITLFDTLNSNAATDIYVRSTLLYFGGNVIGGSRVAQPQFFTF